MFATQNKLTDDEKKKIIAKLTEKKIVASCPMCGNKNFTLADGYFTNTLQMNPQGGLVIGGPSIPTIAIICMQCGFISQHALGILGLLQQPEGGTK
jgi:hypothetical protein